jgi:hypothetical protein
MWVDFFILSEVIFMKFVEKKSCLSCGSYNLDKTGNCNDCRMADVSKPASPTPVKDNLVRNILIGVGAFAFFMWVFAFTFSGKSTQTPNKVSTPASANPPASLVLSPFSRSGKVDVKEDRFTGKTVVDLKSVPVPNGVTIGGFFVNSEPKLTLSLTSGSESWRYLKCHTTDFLVDGAPFNPGTLDYSGTVGTGFVMEFFYYSLSYPSLVKLANAQTVEVKICNDEYRFGQQDINALREFASYYPTYHPQK